jgi:hypothetical protein
MSKQVTGSVDKVQNYSYGASVMKNFTLPSGRLMTMSYDHLGRSTGLRCADLCQFDELLGVRECEAAGVDDAYRGGERGDRYKLQRAAAVVGGGVFEDRGGEVGWLDDVSRFREQWESVEYEFDGGSGHADAKLQLR